MDRGAESAQVAVGGSRGSRRRLGSAMIGGMLRVLRGFGDERKGKRGKTIAVRAW